MNKTISTLLLSLFAISAHAQTVAFVDVNVVPMDRVRVLSHQTVIVRNGLISEIGDTKRVKLPQAAQQIDGAGKFLIPGLADMHVHLFTDDEFPDALAEGEFKIMITHGVTTIRLMTGTPEQLELRRQSASEEILAPTIYPQAEMNQWLDQIAPRFQHAMDGSH
jgi:cytosine/adenosine deaminase-related metal-dependent hydrolase